MDFSFADLTERHLERLVINDALISASGHQIDMIDPGYPHELAFCLRFGTRILYLSRQTEAADRHDLLAFLATADWGALGVADLVSEWRREEQGASGNPLWEAALKYVRVPYQAGFFAPTTATGQVRREFRMKHAENHHLAYAPNGAIHEIASGHAVMFTEHQCVLVAKNGWRSGCRSGVLQVESIRTQHLQDMTAADLFAEGCASWEDFARQWSVPKFLIKPETAVWVIRFVPVFTYPDEFSPSLFAAPPILDSTPLQLALPGVG